MGSSVQWGVATQEDIGTSSMVSSTVYLDTANFPEASGSHNSAQPLPCLGGCLLVIATSDLHSDVLGKRVSDITEDMRSICPSSITERIFLMFWRLEFSVYNSLNPFFLLCLSPGFSLGIFRG